VVGRDEEGVANLARAIKNWRRFISSV